MAWATNAITEGRARFRIGTQWFSRSGCWNSRAPARPCGRGKLAQFSLLQRFAVWWVAPPWPILSVPAVLLALCRLVEKKLNSGKIAATLSRAGQIIHRKSIDQREQTQTIEETISKPRRTPSTRRRKTHKM